MPPSFNQSIHVFDEEEEDIEDELDAEEEEDRLAGGVDESISEFGDGDEDMVDDPVEEEGEDDDHVEEDARPSKRQRDENESRPIKRQRNDYSKTDSPANNIADQVVDALLPRLETRLNEMVNGVALRMLEALGGRLNNLESRMEEMQQEWRDALQADEEDERPSRTQPQQPAVRGSHPNKSTSESQAKKSMPYWRQRIAQDPSRQVQQAAMAAFANPDPIHSFFQEAANLAHDSTSPEPESSNGSLPIPLNRKKPHAVRREKAQPASELRESLGHPSGHFSLENLEARRDLKLGPLSEKPFAANTAAPSHTPQYRLNRGLLTVIDLWKEFFVGGPDKPAINDLDRRYGSAWRHKNSSECTYYSLRRTVIDELVSRVEKRGVDLESSSDDVAKVWQEVAEEMEAERLESKASLNQYIQDLKRRDRVNTPPQPPARAYDPINGPLPPPQPVLSRNTSTVPDLWKEWFDGKDDYQGHAHFPSVIALNQKWGDAWRRWKTPEYAIYLKRRCIIDIALKRILEKGGDRELATRTILREMEEEREREGLSLVQYNIWIRVKYTYHAAARDHVPMEFVEYGRLTPVHAKDAPGTAHNEHQEPRTLAPAPPTNDDQVDDSSADA